MHKQFLFLLISLALLQVCFCSLPAFAPVSSLRFQEVTSDKLADNSVGQDKLKPYSVGTLNLQTDSVTADKIKDGAIYQEHFAPRAVTSGSVAIDIVTIHISGKDPIEAIGSVVNIPVGPNSVQPWEGVGGNSVVIDLPSPTTSYRVQGNARGPGVILGWYPARNGHLLRYQSSRALRQLTCADTGIEYIDLTLYCACWWDWWWWDDCHCATWYTYDNTDWIQDRTCSSPCSLTQPLDNCNDAYLAGLPDNQCYTYPPWATDPDPLQPDQCHSWTSVEDVFNPQEGVPVYSPSVESVSIDTEGKITLSFFGWGGVEDYYTCLANNPATFGNCDPDIDINVVVLLDEQYGA